MWKKLVLLCIKGKEVFRLKDEKEEGGSDVYLMGIFIIMFMVLIFKVELDINRIYVTGDAIEDALTTSLLSSCVYNRDELALSNQLVIYRTITPMEPFFQLTPGVSPPGVTPPGAVPYDPLNDTEIYTPGTDHYLDNAYDNFIRTLKKNLKLDNDMNATTSGIRGEVKVDYYAIYNVFKTFDASNNVKDFRVVRYRRTESGTWDAYAYDLNTPAEVTNSLDGSLYEITETTVVGSLTMDIVATDYVAWLMPGMTQDDAVQTISYQRIVDITER